MPLRLSVFLLLLIIRVLVAPAWFATHIHEVRDAEATWEQVRLHKRRSSFTDDITPEEATLISSESVVLRFILRLLAVLVLGMLTALLAPLFPDQPSPFSCPLFLRHRVLRI